MSYGTLTVLVCWKGGLAANNWFIFSSEAATLGFTLATGTGEGGISKTKTGFFTGGGWRCGGSKELFCVNSQSCELGINLSWKLLISADLGRDGFCLLWSYGEMTVWASWETECLLM